MAKIVARKGTAEFLTVILEVHMSEEEAKRYDPQSATLQVKCREVLGEHLKGRTRCARNNVPL